MSAQPFIPSGYASWVPACLAGIKTGRVHLCRVAGKNVRPYNDTWRCDVFPYDKNLQPFFYKTVKSDAPRTCSWTGGDAWPTPSGEYGVQLYCPWSCVNADSNSKDPSRSIASRAPLPLSKSLGTSGATTRSSLDQTTLVTAGVADVGQSRWAGRPRAT